MSRTDLAEALGRVFLLEPVTQEAVGRSGSAYATTCVATATAVAEGNTQYKGGPTVEEQMLQDALGCSGLV